MNELQNIINVGNTRGYVDQTSGVVFLNLEDVSYGLGFGKVEIKNGVSYNSIRKSRVIGHLQSIGFDHDWSKDFLDIYIPENVFYMLAMKANSTPAIAFQQKIANEILPMIRRTGMYMTDQVYNELISNPGRLGQMLINYQEQIDKMKPGYEKWNNWLSSKNLEHLISTNYLSFSLWCLKS